MHDKQRRGRRPITTDLVSERRIPGGREFVFAPRQREPALPGRPLRAQMTARAFSWREEEVAANDPSVRDESATNDQEFAEFLRALRAVYRARGGGR